MAVETPHLFPFVHFLHESRRHLALPLALVILAICGRAGAQSTSPGDLLPSYGAPAEPLPDAPLPQNQDALAGSEKTVTLHDTPVNIVRDQGAIWSSPARIRVDTLKWLVPLGLATAVTMTTDHEAVTSVISKDKTFNHHNDIASNVFTAGLIIAPVAMFGRGQLKGDDQDREAGILGGEAILDGVVVEQGMKLIFWRERPSMDGGRGKFFQRSVGVDSSFPSSHSLLAWSSAAVLAEEYPSWWAQAGIYSMAAGVSLTRVLALEHFPSDVLVGSAAGWLVGHYVYRKRHKVRVPTY